MPTRTDLLNDLRTIQKRLSEIFDEPHLAFDSAAVPSSTAGYWSPVVDCYETEEKFVIIAEVPGVTREDIDLQVYPMKLILSGERKPGPEMQNQDCLRVECPTGRFQRMFEFNTEIDTSRVGAAMNHGVIRVTLPKRNPMYRRIPIQNAP